MARRTNYGFDKRQKEKLKQEKQQKKRERRQERKEARESGEIGPDDGMIIAPLDPADLGLDGENDADDDADRRSD